MLNGGKRSSRVLVGAEARVSIGETTKKVRVKKDYRHETIDTRLRKRRTKSEGKILRDAKRAGVNVPKVISVDKFSLEMETIEGTRLKDMERIPAPVCELVGEELGKLHSAGIAHLDLTTSNLILSDEKVYMIDFGLSKYGKLEDFGVDLHLLRRAMIAAHKNANTSFEAVLIGYKKTFVDADAAIKREEQIDKRGRYKEK